MALTIVFDLDGTLVETAPDLIEAMNAVFAREQLPPVPYDEGRNMIGGGARKMIEAGLNLSGRAVGPDDLNRMFRHFIEHYSAHIADHSRLFPGVDAALDKLASRGCRLAVCTNKVESLSKQLLASLGLTRRFEAICGPDTFGMPKPDPEILRRTIQLAGGHPRHAVMVGDSGTDIATARAAGLPVVAVDFGYSETPVAELKPDRLISHYDQLTVAVLELAPTVI